MTHAALGFVDSILTSVTIKKKLYFLIRIRIWICVSNLRFCSVYNPGREIKQRHHFPNFLLITYAKILTLTSLELARWLCVCVCVYASKDSYAAVRGFEEAAKGQHQTHIYIYCSFIRSLMLLSCVGRAWQLPSRHHQQTIRMRCTVRSSIICLYFILFNVGFH